MSLSAADLLGLQLARNAFFPDRATNSRTGLTTGCALDTLTKDQRIGSLIDLVHVRRWDIRFPYGTDIAVGDLATVTGAAAGTYFLSEMIENGTFSVSQAAEALKIESTVTASTKREGGPIAPGQTSSWTTHLSTLNCWVLGGALLHPESPRFMEDQFGAVVEQPAKIFASWTNPYAEDFPVQPKDLLVLPQGSYLVEGAECFNGSYISIWIGDPLGES